MTYWIMQILGFRLHRFTGELYGPSIAGQGARWLWIPRLQYGTYVERANGWVNEGYSA